MIIVAISIINFVDFVIFVIIIVIISVRIFVVSYLNLPMFVMVAMIGESVLLQRNFIQLRMHKKIMRVSWLSQDLGLKCHRRSFRELMILLRL